MRALTGLLLSLSVGIGVLAGVDTGVANAAPPPPSHPILGIWRLNLPELGCMETYRFRGDGTTLVTSAEEISESEFQIPEEPSAKGFYRLDDRIVKDNGKKDCTGAVMQVGARATNYIRFHPSGSLFLMCADETMNTCIGPFERVDGLEI